MWPNELEQQQPAHNAKGHNLNPQTPNMRFRKKKAGLPDTSIECDLSQKKQNEGFLSLWGVDEGLEYCFCFFKNKGTLCCVFCRPIAKDIVNDTRFKLFLRAQEMTQFSIKNAASV